MAAHAPTLLLAVVIAACTSPPRAGSPAAHRDGPRVGNARIHFEAAGPESTEALVLVHGWASSSVAWRHQFPDLATRARVLVVDLVGHGQSGAPDEPLTMALMADSVVAAMDAAGVERAVLVGHSNGVPVIQNVLARYPERTLALVGIDGSLRPVIDAAAFDGLFAPFRSASWRDAMAAMIDGMPAPGLADEDRSAIREMALATPQATVVGGAEAALAAEAWNDDPIDVPLLLILAAQPKWNEDYETYVRTRAPGVDYRVWSGVGHYVQMERPGELRAALLEFLEQNALLQ